MRGRTRLPAARLSSTAAPSVSVVITCYNYARFLPDAVASALAQEGVDVDVVIVDDASTDDSVEVAQRLCERDGRVALVRHLENRGHVESANEALARATGTYVVKLDADDLLTPGSLARSVALMEARPEVVFCYGHPERFTGSAVPAVPPGGARSWTVWDGDAWVRRVLRRGHNVIMQPEVLLRREAVERTGGYRTELRWAEDYNWWLRLASTGSVGRVNGVTQGLYRVHDDSFQRSATDVAYADLTARVDAVRLFLGERDGDADALGRLAYSALAREARMQAADRVRRDEPRADACRELADRLDELAGGRRWRLVSARESLAGAVYRNLLWRARHHRWVRYGT